MERRKPLQRGEPPKRGRPPKPEGARGRQKRFDRLAIRLRFFKEFATEGHGPEDWIAVGQICGQPLGWFEADACHKLDASIGGKNEPENILVCHGGRCGPRSCNGWMDDKMAVKLEARASSVNAKTGGVVQWSSEIQEQIRQWLERWHPMSGPGDSRSI